MIVPYNDLKRIHSNLEKKFHQIFDVCLQNNNFIGGAEVRKFEDHLSKVFEIENVVACGNGTDALVGALRALNLQPDDEVIVPAMTWISSAEVINLVGGTPVFCDVNQNTMVAEAENISEKITERTRAIILVHLYGNMPNMDKISSLLRGSNISLIEDCAQAHLSRYKNVTAGNFGEFGTFSFFPGKNLGALGDAGAICAKSPKDLLFLRKFFNHGALEKHNHEIIGTNSRLDTLQAMILDEKLEYLEEWTEDRRRIAKIYNDELMGFQRILVNDNVQNSYHIYPILVDDREKLLNYLTEVNIGFNINYPCALHMQACYVNHHNIRAFNSEFIADRQVSLPIFPGMTESEQSYVVDCLNVYKKRFS